MGSSPTAWRRATSACLLAVTLLIAGCGNSRTTVPSVYQPVKPVGHHTLGYIADGFVIEVPNNWSYGTERAIGNGSLTSEVHPPVVLLDASGAAVIAVSRFPLSAQPVGSTELQQDATALLAAVRAKDRHFKLSRMQTISVTGRPAVVLSGTERISGQTRRVISTHVYDPHHELVLDEYAPARMFASVKHEFARVRASFTLLPVKAP
jgi:hypothetical protein